MSDQNGDKTEPTEAESTPQSAPESHPDAVSAAAHASSIEGAAEDFPPAEPHVSAFAPAEAAAETGADPEPSPAPETAARSGGLHPVALLIGAVALGGGAYYLWDAYVAAPPETPKIAAMAPPAPVKLAPPALPEAAAPSSPAPKPTQDAEPAKPAPVAAPVAETTKKAEAPPPPPAVGDNPTPAKPQTEASPPENKAAGNADTEKTVADMAEKLATAQAAVERLTERLQTVESQLAAPKNDARATTSARESGAGNAGEAAARLVVAQSLLNALRQGDDFSAQIAALQSFGGDAARLAPLRAGLAAPTVAQLTAAFAALAPKLLAAAAPGKPAEEAKPAQDARGSILGFISSEAHKLVRIRPAGAPDKDAAAVQIEQIEKDLRADDLAAALSARQTLPAPALSLSADWAAAAQARLDAEAAAKAELAQALQNLTKTKS